MWNQHEFVFYIVKSTSLSFCVDMKSTNKSFCKWNQHLNNRSLSEKSVFEVAHWPEVNKLLVFSMKSTSLSFCVDVTSPLNCVLSEMSYQGKITVNGKKLIQWKTHSFDLATWKQICCLSHWPEINTMLMFLMKSTSLSFCVDVISPLNCVLSDRVTKVKLQ